jgi:hypothetical protein
VKGGGVMRAFYGLVSLNRNTLQLSDSNMPIVGRGSLIAQHGVLIFLTIVPGYECTISLVN